MTTLNEVKRIYKCPDEKLYKIEFNDGKCIRLTKRRTIIALLVLIHKGQGTESDLAQGNTTIPAIKKILNGKFEDGLFNDFYRDANKPYSELWNEEGFTFIDNLKGGREGKSQVYVLKKSDHSKLFNISLKANRRAPNREEKEIIRSRQSGKCNLCGSILQEKNKLRKDSYAKDRRREVFDHRIPIEKNGQSELGNFQALCFYCNKSKWQICNICELKECSPKCALRNPEKYTVVAPTGEYIGDLMYDRLIGNPEKKR